MSHVFVTYLRNVACGISEIMLHMSLSFSAPCRMSLSLMLPVDFKKRLLHRVKFRGRGPFTPQGGTEL